MKNRFKKGWRRIKNMYQLHGLFPVASFYLSRLYPLKWIFRHLSWRWLIKVKIQGSWMCLNAYDPGISTTLLTEGIREAEHVQQVKNNLKPSMSGIDLGANVGYYALIEAQRIGKTGKIFAIEPEPGNIDLLKKNIQANDFEDIVSVSQYIIGDQDKMSELRISALSNRHSMSTANRYKVQGTDKAITVKIPMIKLDTFMEKNNIQPKDIDFLRMDIEGYEVMVLQGMSRLLSATTPLKIFIELHPKWYGEWGWTFEKLLNYLGSFSLHIKSIAYKSEGGTVVINNPTREQVLATEHSPFTINGGSHAYLERL
jgi:FkbM family methyltransferase